MSKPDLCIAIPTYNREDVLIDTINDSLKQSHNNIEIIVVDQSKSHTKKTSKALESISDPRFRYFSVDPPSVTAARNFALNNANAPIVLFLDDDVRFDKHLAKNHLGAYSEHPEISATAGRVMQSGFPIKKGVLKFDEYAISHGVFTATESGYTNAFPGGNCSMKVLDALSVGGFDTRYYGNAFREENDMSLKMIRAGMSIFYESSAELLHLAAPYGGNRVKGHIYDSGVFYSNELFFTIRNAAKGKKLRAIKLKYREYCEVPSRRVSLRRKYLFVRGLISGAWRFVDKRQCVAKVRT